MAAIPAAGAKLRASVLSSLITTGWSAWTPTLANLTLGSGTVVARWRQSGNGVNYAADFFFSFLLGAGSAVGTLPSFTLPFTPASHFAVTSLVIGRGDLIDTGVAAYFAVGRWTATSTVEVVYLGASGVHTSVTAAAPFAWGSGDRLVIEGTGIEIA
jgi:hypothetical protein